MDGMWGNKFWTKLDKWVGWAKCAMSNGWGSPQLPQLPQLLDLVTATSWFLDLFLTPKTGFKGARNSTNAWFSQTWTQVQKNLQCGTPNATNYPQYHHFSGWDSNHPQMPGLSNYPNHPQPSPTIRISPSCYTKGHTQREPAPRSAESGRSHQPYWRWNV